MLYLVTIVIHFISCNHFPHYTDVVKTNAVFVFLLSLLNAWDIIDWKGYSDAF